MRRYTGPDIVVDRTQLSLAEIMAIERYEDAKAPLEEAEILAYARDPNETISAEIRLRARRFAGRGPINAAVRTVLNLKVANEMAKANAIESSVQAELDLYKSAKWYTFSKRFYDNTIERAQRMGRTDLVQELAADKALSATQHYLQSKDPNHRQSTVAHLTEGIALVIGDLENRYIFKAPLAQGAVGAGPFNPTLRSKSGFGAQGERHIEIKEARDACEILGIPLPLGQEIERILPMEAQSDFGLQRFMGGKGRFRDTKEYSIEWPDTNEGLDYGLSFVPERTDEMHGDIRYVPEHIYLIASSRTE